MTTPPYSRKPGLAVSSQTNSSVPIPARFARSGGWRRLGTAPCGARGLVALAGIFSIGAGVVVVAWPSPTITLSHGLPGCTSLSMASRMAFRLRSAAS